MGAPSGNGSSYTSQRYLTGDPFIDFIANAVVPESAWKSNNTFVNKPIDNTVNPYPSVNTMFPNLSTNLLQPKITGAMDGAGRFSNLLRSQINYNAPTNTMQNNYESSYKPTAWDTSDAYKLGSVLSTSNHPLFNWMGNDLMSANPVVNWTITSTPTTNTQGK